MTNLNILHYPHPLLKAHAEDVTDFGDELKTFCNTLLETMRDAPGIGITACHVGILKRIVVIETEKGKPLFYINPRISWSGTETVTAKEGSVSMPGVIDEIMRPKQVRVVYNDLDGKMQEDEAEGFLAVCLQHEIDQLDGIFWLDRLSRLKRDRVIKKYKKVHVCSHEGCC
ncbi:MAG: peptide deformylase [Pseudomonadota bacterium]